MARVVEDVPNLDSLIERTSEEFTRAIVSPVDTIYLGGVSFDTFGGY